MALYETDTSVFELMWDLGVAKLILHNAFSYFIITFLWSYLHTYLRLANILPYNHLTTPSASTASFVWQVISVALWARATIVFNEIPRNGAIRLAVGILGGVFMVVAELVEGIIAWETGHKEWLWKESSSSAVVGVLSLLLFVAMPRLLMLLEKNVPRRVEESKHSSNSDSTMNEKE